MNWCPDKQYGVKRVRYLPPDHLLWIRDGDSFSYWWLFCVLRLFFLPAFFVSKLSEASYTCRGTISHPENEHPRSVFKSVFLISLNLHVSVIVIIFELVMLSSGGFSVVVRFLIVSTRRRHRRVAARSIKEFRAVFLNVLWFFFPSVCQISQPPNHGVVPGVL